MASPRDRPTDPDFDPPRIAWPAETELARCRRVIVNPFLALGALGAWAGLMQWLRQADLQALGLLGTSLLVVVPFLVHYHCVDCGKTGALPACKSHACAGLVARWRQSLRPRYGWPRPATQLILWGLGLTALLVAFTIAAIRAA